MKYLSALRAITGLAVLMAAGPAFANRPALAGYSGKTGQTCAAGNGGCHTGGTAPAVSFQGPTTLAAGQTAEYQFTVQAGAVSANIATEDYPESPEPIAAANAMPRMSGLRLTAGAGLAASFADLIDGTNPQTDRVRGGPFTYRFNVTAPKYAGTVRLWGTGMSVSGGGSGGDGVRAATFTINVTGPAYNGGSSTSSSSGGSTSSTSSSGASTSSSTGGTSTSSGGTSTSSGGTSSGGSTSGSSGGTSSGGSSGSSGSSGADDLGDDGSDDEGGGRGSLNGDGGGCAVAEGHGLLGSAGGAFGAGALGLVVGGALLRRRRRA